MNSIVRFSFFAVCMLIVSHMSFAQQSGNIINYSHADDILLQQAVAKDPQLINQYILYEENFRQLIKNSGQGDAKTDTLIDGKRIIPVVFHIIHKGGAENISKDQILDALDLLNQDYNKQNADTGTVHSWAGFASRRADCKIEFRLARIDPDGNCTEGIVRHYDPQTNYAYFSTMADYAWSPGRYMNIYSVAFIYPEGMTLPEGAFIGGMSPFPPSNPLTQALTGGDTLVDGILIRHDGLGSIGTATTLGGMPINALNRTFTHETGHYFNLYHTFQNLMLGLIPAASGCPSLFAPNGDEVSDTPPVDVPSQNTGLPCFIPGDRNTCTQDNPDEPDMVENYMDYQWGYCMNIFTTGQYARINATMNGDRRKLWSLENLLATGVLDTTPPACPPVADFYANTMHICAGESITFSDFSYQASVDAWDWTFSGGDPAVSQAQNPAIQYQVPGVYDVKLTVSNANGADSLLRTAYVHVHDPGTATAAPFTEGFESGNLGGWNITNDVGNTWEITSSANFSGSKSLMLRNFENNTPGSTDEIISPVYDFTQLPPGTPPSLKFRLAYAGKRYPGTIITPADTAYDRLRIFVSSNCGATWTQRYGKSGMQLATVTNTPDNFAPASPAEWRQESALLPMSYLSENSVMLKFVFESNGGNNIYIDDININSANAGTDPAVKNNWNAEIYPNPFTESTSVDIHMVSEGHVSIDVLDLLGRTVCRLSDGSLPSGEHHFSIPKAQLGRSGMYFVKIQIDGTQKVMKIIAE